MNNFTSLLLRFFTRCILLPILAVTLTSVLLALVILWNSNRRDLDLMHKEASRMIHPVQSMITSGYRQEELDKMVLQWSHAGNIQVRILDFQGNLLAQAGPPAAVQVELPVGHGEFDGEPPVISVLSIREPGLRPESLASLSLRIPSSAYAMREENPSKTILIEGITYRTRSKVMLPFGNPKAPLGYVEVSRGPDFSARSLSVALLPILLSKVVVCGSAVFLGISAFLKPAKPLRTLSEEAVLMSGRSATNQEPSE